jgi:iron complex transport system ATP-binding protein
MNRLKVEDLACGYERSSVLRNLSLEVHPGEVLVLLGPNGVGKTTLLRVLARLIRPTRGVVRIQDQDVWKFSGGEFARQVALMPQAERRDWPLTVQESVRLGRAPHRGWFLPLTADDERIVNQAIQSAGLADLHDRPITTLSGGEWRRVTLARALAQEARVLLLDEPTAGLDLKYQVEVLELVRSLALQEDLVVVLTMHDLNQASVYADRLAVLAEGGLAAIGAPSQVLTEELVQAVFGLPVTILEHPVYGTPLVVPRSEYLDAAGGEGS